MEGGMEGEMEGGRGGEAQPQTCPGVGRLLTTFGELVEPEPPDVGGPLDPSEGSLMCTCK